MASQGRRTRIGQSRWPKQALALFVLLLAIVYALIFFLPDRSPIPKLGIDLQGGTRVTLVPQGERHVRAACSGSDDSGKPRQRHGCVRRQCGH